MISLILYNRHWEKGFFYPYTKERFIISELKKDIDKKFISIVAGLRRTGKTVLLFQLINFLIKEKNIKRDNILYFTFDEEKVKLGDLLYEYEKQTGISWKNEKIYIFLDEIQKLDNFQNQIKIFYDLYPNIKFVISGSTSMFIKKKTTESLAGRVKIIHLTPLTFKEFLFFLDSVELLERPKIYKKELRTEFEKYWLRQFIETINFEKEDIVDYLKTLVKKIIYEDIPAIYEISKPEILIKIVKYLANYPGTLINFEKMSDIFEVDRKTLSKYFKTLTYSYLVRILYNFSKNLIKSEKKLKKAYLSSTSFVIAYNEFILQDEWKKNLLAENSVISTNNFDFFWRDTHNKEVDFINVKDDKIEGIEVKYANRIRKEDFKNLISLKRNFNDIDLIMVCPDDIIQNDFYEINDIKIQLKSIYKI